MAGDKAQSRQVDWSLAVLPAGAGNPAEGINAMHQSGHPKSLVAAAATKLLTALLAGLSDGPAPSRMINFGSAYWDEHEASTLVEVLVR